ncbi:MAG: ion channel [Cyanobacteriota bacterium]|nr:ion channel [Cyanobacteriota bacterium]
MPPLRQKLRRESGLLAGRHRPAWRHWREPYLLALAIPWPAFLALIAALYLAINLLFAGLFQLDPTGIGGTEQPRSSFAEAFFFSVQTLGSIGYGVLHPRGLYANVLVSIESLSGLLFVAITTGLVFARFARSNTRIRFSEVAVVHLYNGVPTLSFRLANERGNILREVKLQAYLAIDEFSLEGHRLRRLRPLVLERDRGMAFLLVWTAMHRLEASSPLHGIGREELARLHAEVVVAFSGVDQTIERPVHAQAHWPLQRLRFGFCFADMIDDPPRDARDAAPPHIDWSAFDRIRPCP